MRAWGWVEPAELERVVVISPHPDDAVLSCGQFLSRHPGHAVITVFCGLLDRYPNPPNRWAQLSGFTADDDIAERRRAEDRAALAVLGATPIHLDGFPEADLQPDAPVATATQVAAALDAALAALDPTLVLLPLGLANPEHVTTHDAAVAVREQWVDAGRATTWIAYQDVAYHQIPGLLAWRVSKLFRSGLWPTPVAMPIDPDLATKAEALACYPSQVQALDADWDLGRRLDATVAEQYWRLAPPPPGWEPLADL